MAEPYQRRVQTKDPPVEKFVRAIKVVGDWIIKKAKALIVPSAAGADALVIRDYGDTTDRMKITEDGKITVIPSTAGGNALVVRDTADTVDRMRFTEDGTGMIATKLTVGRTDVQPEVLHVWGKAYIRYLWVAINVQTRLLPYPDNSLDFGSSLYRWRDLYLGGTIKTKDDVAAYYTLQSHNGVSYIDCAKLIGGYLEIAKGKLTGNLELKSFDAGTSVTIDAGLTYTVPNGVYYVFLGANTSAEAYDDVALAWKTIIAAGGSGLVISDGTNVRLYNAAAVAESSNIRRAF